MKMFREIAEDFFGVADETDIVEFADILCDAYCDGLRACSWRAGGIEYLFEGHDTEALEKVIDIVKRTGRML